MHYLYRFHKKIHGQWLLQHEAIPGD